MRYEVVVVGAGVAGPVAARNLAREGYNVLLIDKKAEIGAPKRCAEGLDLEALKRNGIPLDKRFINREIKGICIHSPSGYRFEVKFNETKGLILERKVFDKFLAYHAAKAGADVMPKTEATGLIRRSGKIVGVRAEREGNLIEIEADVIVAADGIESRVARWAGINSFISPHEVDPVYEYEMIINGFYFDPDLFHLYFGNKVAPRGYAWIFPKDEDRANVGIGINGDNPKTAKYYLDKWLEKNGIKTDKILEINAGGVPVGKPLKELVKENVVVIGDAARQLFMGGGMAESIDAASIASKWIARALEESNISLLDNYAKEWWETRGKVIMVSVKIINMLEKITDKDLDVIIEAMSKIDTRKFMRGDHKGIMIDLLKNPKIMLNPKIIKLLRLIRLISLPTRFA